MSIYRGQPPVLQKSKMWSFVVTGTREQLKDKAIKHKHGSQKMNNNTDIQASLVIATLGAWFPGSS